MASINSKYNIRLDYKSSANLNETVNKETLARYLYDGSYARPGTKHFLNGYYYQEIEKINPTRNKVATIKDIEDQIRLNIIEILSTNEKVSLLLTSGLDSYLIYLILKSETNNFTTKNEVSFLTGRFLSPYDEYSVLENKRGNIKLDPACNEISGPDEALDLLKASVFACNQPVNGLVAAAVYKAINIAADKKSVPILGTGETIFFTSTYDFIDQVNASTTRNYSADKTIQIPGDFLTEAGLEMAIKGQKNNLDNQHQIFNYENSMEEFIHNQQFWIDAPRVDYEVSSYCNHFNINAFTPLRDPKLLELFLNLPKEMQHDGRPKTVIRNLISSLEGRDDYSDGLKMTSPQREYLRYSYKDGGFAELVDHFISNSFLIKFDIVDRNKIITSYEDYKRAFDKSILDGNFTSCSSYNIWKFFITELWLHQKNGNEIDIKKIT